MRFALLAILLAGLGGCTSSQSLLGHDEAYVIRALGKPESREVGTMPTPEEERRPGGFGPWHPYAKGALAGETFIELYYHSVWGEQWYVFLASPAAFERTYGKKPDSGGLDCVIEVQKYGKHTVF